MTAAIPTPILPPDGAVASLGASNNITIKQSDTHSGSNFGELLGEALSGTTADAPINDGASGEAADLLGQLQSLPQGGKLLPVLNQLLDDAAAGGSAAEQVLMQLNTSLEQLSQNTELGPMEAVAAALYQVVEANPHYFGEGKLQQLSTRQLIEGIWQQLTASGSARSGATAAEPALGDAGVRMLDQIPAQASPPGQVQAELAAALQAVRRLTSGQVSGQDASVKSEAIIGNQIGAGAATTGAAPNLVSAAPALTLGVPINQANWDQALGERIQWLVSQGSQGAQIKLNPAHLGPMEVRIQMQHDQANIQFTATHAVVREALEAALPRLREMLGASGVELVNVDVSGESFAEQQRTGDDREAGDWATGGHEVAESHETVIETPLISVPESGRLDLFV